MFSFSRRVLLLVLSASVSLGCGASEFQASAYQAPASARSDGAATQQPASQQPAESQSEQTAKPATASPTSVQARIRARREQRRIAAIHEVYDHLYEAYVGAGFARTVPGPTYQRFNLYLYNVGFTRYFNEKLGVTVDGRGSYGTAYIGNNPYNVNHPAISEYSGMIGPNYRFILHPKYSVSGRVLGGAIYGNFTGDTIGEATQSTNYLGLYPNGTAIIVTASGILEYNVSSSLGLRVAPEYRLTDFSSSIQSGWGLTGGFVYRWGKQ
jgi:hypothetical protein